MSCHLLCDATLDRNSCCSDSHEKHLEETVPVTKLMPQLQNFGCQECANVLFHAASVLRASSRGLRGWSWALRLARKPVKEQMPHPEEDVEELPSSVDLPVLWIASI